MLKARDRCFLARGIWTDNNVNDKNVLYRHNAIKVEALPGNLIDEDDVYYNHSVNNAVTPITVHGGGWTSEKIADALIFEDNRLISNVNHIIIGEGYGIGSGTRFYRTTFEKIDHDSAHRYFEPIRIGFWYWNTLKTRIIDSTFVGIAEDEIAPPHFYGGSGKMDIFYGEKKKFLFLDAANRPLANKDITLTTGGGDFTQTEQTDNEGKAEFDILSTRHFKLGNSLEIDGITGIPGRTDYQEYTFSVKGYYPYILSP